MYTNLLSAFWHENTTGKEAHCALHSRAHTGEDRAIMGHSHAMSNWSNLLERISTLLTATLAKVYVDNGVVTSSARVLPHQRAREKEHPMLHISEQAR